MKIESKQMKLDEGNKGNKGNKGSAIIILVLVVAVALSSIYMGWVELGDGVLERVPPKLKILEKEKILGFGLVPTEITIDISDDGMGLDELIIRAEQNRERVDIANEKFNGEKEKSYTITLGGPETPFDEGEVALEIRVFDRSFWSNSVEQRLTIPVDKKKPKISVFSTQHNAQEGGSQLVFYKAKDAHLKSSGVMVGSKRFYGFKAQFLDPQILDDSAFAVIYAVPVGGAVSERDIKVFAEDMVGNLATASFYNKIFSRRFKKPAISIPDSFLSSELPKILSPYKVEVESLLDPTDRERFKLLNETIKSKERSKITSNILLSPISKRAWSGNFMSAGGSPAFRYGEELVYTYKGEPWSSLISDGFILQHSLQQNVFPGQEGEVIFSDSLATYGKTVILDHGLGITSLYGGLENILVKKGERISPERPLGTVGQTGILFKPSYYFEIRIQGQPVTPLEWWDKEWVKSHIENKTREAKRLLGFQEIIDLE